MPGPAEEAADPNCNNPCPPEAQHVPTVLFSLIQMPLRFPLLLSAFAGGPGSTAWRRVRRWGLVLAVSDTSPGVWGN